MNYKELNKVLKSLWSFSNSNEPVNTEVRIGGLYKPHKILFDKKIKGGKLTGAMAASVHRLALNSPPSPLMFAICNTSKKEDIGNVSFGAICKYENIEYAAEGKNDNVSIFSAVPTGCYIGFLNTLRNKSYPIKRIRLLYTDGGNINQLKQPIKILPDGDDGNEITCTPVSNETTYVDMKFNFTEKTEILFSKIQANTTLVMLLET